ncbi:hypothetical protein BTV98_08245 [Psychrobacter sp. Cmf 22.2]|nr:hypothetical protein BTV98_08245 [Psychrobacter sp. Cmf 22.2]
MAVLVHKALLLNKRKNVIEAMIESDQYKKDIVVLGQIFLACCAYADRGYKKFVPIQRCNNV